MSQTLTIQQILDKFGEEIPQLFGKVLGGLPKDAELIRKQLPARLLRFDEDDTAAISVVSSLRQDRDREVMLPEGMDKTNYSGIVLWNHDYWRDDIPHATNMWLNMDPPRGEPYRVISKTQYLIELSDLGDRVYRYRLGEHPLGQSVGFRTTESVRKGQTGYEEAFKAWLPRVKAMLKELGLKAAPGEFDEPSQIITKWELWEYSDVFIGSNVDALQIAVKSGMITNDEARLLVDFSEKETPEDEDQVADLLERVADLEGEIKMLKAPSVIPQPMDLQEMWGAKKTTGSPIDLDEMWNGNEME